MCVSVACLPLLAAAWSHFPREGFDAPRATSPHKLLSTPFENTQAPRPTEAADENRPSSSIILAAASDAKYPTNAVVFASSEQTDPDENWRRLAVGEWEDEYQGKRYLTVASDGTGKMVVELEGIGKKIFAPRLSFDLNWTLSEGMVTMTTLGGEPASKVKVVLKLYGNEAQYKILELTADRMLLLDGDGKTQYDWRRPKSGRSETSAAADTQ
ncbi:MAG: hypothetical protein JSS02_30840 [Planctomycetes bacterium]|nr:hypothetical protein [Planctomycetota bacterium]